MAFTKNPGRFAGFPYKLPSITGCFALIYVPSRVLQVRFLNPGLAVGVLVLSNWLHSGATLLGP
jgi:hypothetical protein